MLTPGLAAVTIFSLSENPGKNVRASKNNSELKSINLQEFCLLWEVPSQFTVISVISSLLQKMHNMFGPKSKIRLWRMQKQS